ncbi:MAG: hypothetical protein JWM10_5072 [Myxococcaceae bacterium]|nr:hypothetical protein [Myxococcaceae bacterium]
MSPEDGGAAPSLAARVAQERETAAQRRAYLTEAAASVVVVGFYGAMLLRLREPWFVALAVAHFLFVVLWMGNLTRLRRGTWSAARGDAGALLALARARRVADLRWHGFGRAATVAMLLFTLGWAPFLLRARWDRYVAEPWRAALGLGGVLAIVLAVLWYQGRRIDRAARELRALDAAAVGSPAGGAPAAS